MTGLQPLPAGRTRVVISLGSNVDRERNLPAAVALIAARVRVLAVSPVYETAAISTAAPASDSDEAPDPVQRRDDPAFLNAALLIETDLPPARLKREVLRAVEEELGRERFPDRDAPRTLDADITLYGGQVLDYEGGRHLPDPDLLRFVHVAVPVADLLPDQPHPETGEPLREIAERLRLAAGPGALRQCPGIL